MSEDPIVAEIRKVRHAHAAKFNNDVAAIFDDIRRQEKESGRQYVSYPPRRIEAATMPPGETEAGQGGEAIANTSEN
jgi:hypothetical protein